MTDEKKEGEGNRTIFDHENFEKAYAHVISNVGVLDSLSARQLFAEAAMYANLDNYKPTIPTNPLHEIFMSKTKWYMMRKMYPENSDYFHKQEDLEVGRQRMRLCLCMKNKDLTKKDMDAIANLFKVVKYYKFLCSIK
jgi:hypothetical protein